MLKLKTATFGTDQNGDEVFLMAGTEVSEIGSNGPVMSPNTWELPLGWDVIFKVSHPGQMGMDELVTMDAVKLLKALEGI